MKTVDSNVNVHTGRGWDISCQRPLGEVPLHYHATCQSEQFLKYVKTILKLAPSGSRTCELNPGLGYATTWLSHRGVRAEGWDESAEAIEKAKQINNILGGRATFHVLNEPDSLKSNAGVWAGTIASLQATCESTHQSRYQVIHHSNLLHRAGVPWIKAALAQQVVRANWVVFSVPSVYSSAESSTQLSGVCQRLLPLEEWEHILSPFEIDSLSYYGETHLDHKDQIICVLRGQEPSHSLQILMTIASDPYPEGVSAIVHTRNEASRISDCLKTLIGWTDEIIVCDMESSDETRAIARQYTDNILVHPLTPNFDSARNVSAMRANYRWVFYLDADERVPPRLGTTLRALTAQQGDTFEALLPPFRHHFAGHWLQSLYPGYTAPRLFKNGRFFFNPRLHSGAQVDGRIICLPADDPELALVHYSFDSLAHYLDKLNRYTDGESANMFQDGQVFHWQRAIEHFVGDFQSYYDQGGATQDGVYGFIYSFLSAFYRFEQHAKLFERRSNRNTIQPSEKVVPVNVEHVLEFALAVARRNSQQAQRPAPQQLQIVPRNFECESTELARVVWDGPFFSPSGYGEEARNFLLALQETGISVAAQPQGQLHTEATLSDEERRQIEELMDKPVATGYIQICHHIPSCFSRHLQAEICIGRTMFETDRLPEETVKACNRMDYIWVPSEFNQLTFSQAGVAREKLRVIPGCLDPSVYSLEAPPSQHVKALGEQGYHVFLTVFDWTLHKGWDVLLRAFLEEFGRDEKVKLILKVWSACGYGAAGIQQQAQDYIKRSLDLDLASDDRVLFLHERMRQEELLSLYRSVDAFVLPSRGEGWGRPYMEAMALARPVIGTGWSGNTAFMNEDNSYLVRYELKDVPEPAWQEVPIYRGHRWAEPDRSHLRQLMRQVYSAREEAKVIGQQAREDVLSRFSRSVVGKIIATELERVAEHKRTHLKPKVVPQTGSIKEGGDSITVRWEGSQFVWHSLAHVNREFCLRLLSKDLVELSVVPVEANQFGPDEDPRFVELAGAHFSPLSRPADVHVRHMFPPRFEKPEEGQLVLMQPWEYGHLPLQWVEGINQHVSEIWCYSESVRQVYIASGIDEQRLQVIPLGVDTNVFNPHAPPFVFTTEIGSQRYYDICQRSERNEKAKWAQDTPTLTGHEAGTTESVNARPFCFLFTGGTIQRKGIDILLDAYLKAFSVFDDVCLVIKDFGADTVYQGQNWRERIKELANDPTRPAIVYVEEDLSRHQLAGIYTAVNCLVQPYRGEGFCLPVLEAMACGCPVIVPAGGPTDDFVDENVGWRIRAERFYTGDSRVGPWECTGPIWTLEVEPDTLAETLRTVFKNREEAMSRGATAVRRVQQQWTWDSAVAKVMDRLRVLQRGKGQTAVKELPETKQEDHCRSKVMTGDIACLRTPPLADSQEPSPGDQRLVTVTLTVTADRENGQQSMPHISKGSVSLAQRQRPTISLCMIVKNEERVLDACLASIKPWVDEIVVVDTGSTDRTVEIASCHNARIFHYPWCDNFSAARNESIKHATGDWIFWMDADDTISAECGEKLRDLVFTAGDSVTGYIMQVHIPPAPGDHGFTVVDHVKLFRNHPELRFEGRIHEQILEPIYRIGGRVERTDVFVVHSGYDYSEEGQQRKRERDRVLLEKDLQDRPDHPFVLFNIGMTAYHLKDFAQAIPYLEKCLAHCKPQESIVRKVYAMLAGCHLEQQDVNAARKRIEQGLHIFPRDPELLFRAGIIYRELGVLDAAEQSYLKLLNEREVGHIDSLDVTMTGHKANHNLGLIYQDMGRFVEAEMQWRKAVEANPSFVPSWLALGELYTQMRRFEDVRSVAHKLAAIAPLHAESLQQRMEGVSMA